MAVKTEGKHAGEFIVSELPSHGSRSTGTVKQGENLVAGQVVEKDGDGKLVAFTATLDVSEDLITQAAGVLFDNVDASASGTNADVPGAVFLDWTAVLNLAECTIPAENPGTTKSEQDVTLESLARLGIKLR